MSNARPASGLGRSADGDAHADSPRARVVVFEPDAHASAAVLRHLDALGTGAISVRELRAAADAARRSGAQVVVADLADDNRRMQALLADLAELHPRPTVVAVATHLPAARAVRWMRSGVDDIVFKPLRAAEFRAAIGRAIERHALGTPADAHRDARPTRAAADARGRPKAHPLPPSGEAALAKLVGDDPRLRRALELAQAASRVRSTVLIQGETGTGKTSLARAIHLASARGSGPFIELACGSIPESLLEGELFGHVKGAFTGAVADKKGRFLAADGGTIFLDEINAAPQSMQVKLLRVLQERAFEPVGSDETVEVDVRVIVASNQPLERLVEEGRFSPDLFYRVHVLQIDLPPLRERMRDLERLAHHFLRVKSAEIGKTVAGFAPDALDAMQRHRWPGNVRELEHAVERAAILCEGVMVDAASLPERVRGTARDRSHPATRDREAETVAENHPLTLRPEGAERLADRLRAPERAALVAALEAASWNRSEAARSLGINRATLYRKMRDLGLGGGRAAG